MDRIETTSWEDRAEHHRNGAGSAEEPILPSRAKALVGLRSALEEGRGPLLLTGEPGVGKSWLAERLYSAMPAEWRWLIVNVSPALNALDFYSVILNGFGTDSARHLASAQSLLADTLREASADGWRWGLTLEEAHNASPEIHEEIRLLGNSLGRESGFAGILLIGQTAMLRTLAARSMRALEARLAARVHLRPLDVDEFASWAMNLPVVGPLHEPELEFLHRAVRGNPRRFLREIGPRRTLSTNDGGREVIQPKPQSTLAAPSPDDERPWDVAPVVPSKPPLQVADEMIEVGWDATAEPVSAIKPFDSGALAADAAPAEERIDDHYAALQAWNEWSKNQGRQPDAAALSDDPDEAPLDADTADDTSTNRRAEAEHDFAPYSQLFSRLRASKE